jgi:hypothetical protein
MTRHRRPRDLLFPWAIAGCILSWIPLRWPLLRYELPLLPFLAVSAGFVLASLNLRWRVGLGSLAVVFPLLASTAQVFYMRTPHPANRALGTILERVPPGTHIARMAAELPPLDRSVYPMGPNPLLDDISQNPPPWVLTADLAHKEHPSENIRTLQSRYECIARFETPRMFAWATLGEHAAPHDWKYTHPKLALYRRTR